MKVESPFTRHGFVNIRVAKWKANPNKVRILASWEHGSPTARGSAYTSGYFINTPETLEKEVNMALAKTNAIGVRELF